MAFFAGLALFTSACSAQRSPDSREFPLQGQIVSMAADHKEANVKHEEIKGLMAAMTMPYRVRDTREYEPLVAGDLITATLVIVSNDAYLKDVRKVGNAPLDQPAVSSETPASSGFELLKIGESVPNGAFINQDGKPVTIESFRGSTVVVTFIYTSCPIPTFCPLMDRHFAAVQRKLKEQPTRSKTHLLSVSIDPVGDTPPVLKRHALALDADPGMWTFVTGDRDVIDQWASRFGISLSRALNDQRDITHNLRTVIIDRQGNLVRTYVGNAWTPDQLVADVRAMAGVD
jgi:protein SCO1/2